MKEQLVIVYTMKNCPYCIDLKNLLVKEQIEFVDRDIYENEEEYDLFVEAVDGNEYVPAFMIIETDGKNHTTKLFAPDRDFEQVTDGFKIIKEHYKKFKPI